LSTEEDSDLDLLVVAEDKTKVTDLTEKAKRKIGLELRPLIMNQLEWMNLEQTSPEFFDELSHSLILWERTVELFRL
jgi:predicted nucleotidyltransferase